MEDKLAIIGKYVLTENGPVLFARGISHERFRNMEPISAGFFKIEDDSVSTFGKSVSLNLSANSDDAMLLKIAFSGR